MRDGQSKRIRDAFVSVNLKQTVRTFMEASQTGQKVLDLYYSKRKKNRSWSSGSIEDRFTQIYTNNEWSDDESASGAGSTEKYTRQIRESIPAMLKDLSCKVMLDAPCGDFNWMRLMRRPEGLHYIGGDIVKEIVDKNKTAYGDEHTRFLHLDIVCDQLPEADLWLCRDCLFHLSNRDIFLVLRQFAESEIDYLVTSTHSECGQNTDIETGSFRLINLELAPFYFPPAQQYLADWVEGFPVRYLGLWHRSEVSEVLANRLSGPQT